MKDDKNNLLNFSYYESNYLTDYIKTADTKASILITLNGVIIGFILNDLKLLLSNFCDAPVINLLLFFGGAGLLISYYFTLILIFPNLKNTKGSGVIFWEDISRLDQESYQEKIENISSILIELTNQNYHLANTASRKYKLLKNGFLASYFGYFFVLLYYIFSL